MAKSTAKLCQTAIMEDSVQAIADMKAKKASDVFIHLSEIVFAVAGLVGGFGDKYARNAAAHAMHDAMSKYLPQSHHFLHGEKVAYGILYQLALEEKWSMIDALIPFYQELHLPLSFGDMGIAIQNSERIDQVVEFIDSKEKVHLIPISITKEKLAETIIKLEEYNKTKL